MWAVLDTPTTPEMEAMEVELAGVLWESRVAHLEWREMVETPTRTPEYMGARQMECGTPE